MARLQVGHVHVHALKAGLGKGVRHFNMRVHALLAQHRHTRSRELQCGCAHRRGCIKRKVHMQPAVGCIEDVGMFSLRTFWVVAQPCDAPAHAVPFPE